MGGYIWQFSMSILHMQEDHPTMDMLTTECVKEKFCFNVMFAGVGWGGRSQKNFKVQFQRIFFFFNSVYQHYSLQTYILS